MHQLSLPGGGQKRSNHFLAVLGTFTEVILVSHLNPDPDSLASMMGLSHLVEQKLDLPVTMTIDGVISRAENKAMARLLRLPLVPVDQVRWSPEAALVMVDCQPGRQRLWSRAGLTPQVVIDHHDVQGQLDHVIFRDVRPNLGATTTAVTGYLIEQDVHIPSTLATGLFYGIDAEITGYPRESSDLDDQALHRLYPLADKDILAEIRSARLPRQYFHAFLVALENATLYEHLVAAWLGPIDQPDIVAEMAEFLIRFESMYWAYCSGVFGDQIKISVRSNFRDGRAGDLLQRVVDGMGSAGGHNKRAGGTVPLADTQPETIERVRTELRRRLLNALGINPRKGQHLVT